MKAIEVRTTHGMNRLRAGLAFSTSWASYEVTEEQLAAIQADKVLEVRAPQAQVEAQAARVEEVEGEASGLRAQLDAALARIAELEAELLQAQGEAQRALAELDAATAPAPPAPTPTAPQG